MKNLIPPQIEPHKFKKPNGKRGKPNPKSHCAVCGIVWTDHALLTSAAKAIEEAQKAQKAAKRITRTRVVSRAPRPAGTADPQTIEVDVPEPPKPEPTPEELAARRASIVAMVERIEQKWIDEATEADPHNYPREYHKMVYDWQSDWDHPLNWEQFQQQVLVPKFGKPANAQHEQ